MRKIIAFLILCLYIASLTMECYLVNDKASIGSFGLIALLLGWLNFDLIGLIWLANPLFIISLMFFLFSKKTLLTLILSLTATILAISFTQVKEIIWSEAGHTGAITGYLAGYWLWISAISLLFVCSIINQKMSKKTIRLSSNS